MANWVGIGVGTYYQITDSLHIYLDDYGAKETDKILKAYDITADQLGSWRSLAMVDNFVFEDEPRIQSDYTQTEDILDHYFQDLDSEFRSPLTYKDNDKFTGLLNKVEKACCSDRYFGNCFAAMLAYQAHKHGEPKKMCRALYLMDFGSWKISCLRFLSKRYGDIS